jgi:hypothetical protein
VQNPEVLVIPPKAFAIVPAQYEPGVQRMQSANVFIPVDGL